jgi:uncharacterized protein YecT (DUF1311 family)
MKKFLLWMILFLPLSSFAEACIGGGNVYDDLSCVDRSLQQSKRELNNIYQKIYSSTQYKNELEQAQKAWLNYRERQCNGYISAEASQSQGAGPSLITKDCLVVLTKQRVDYLKILLEK